MEEAEAARIEQVGHLEAELSRVRDECEERMSREMAEAEARAAEAMRTVSGSLLLYRLEEHARACFDAVSSHLGRRCNGSSSS